MADHATTELLRAEMARLGLHSAGDLQRWLQGRFDAAGVGSAPTIDACQRWLGQRGAGNRRPAGWVIVMLRQSDALV